MSEREDVVRGAIAAFNEGDMSRVIEFAHPEMNMRQLLPEVGLTSYQSFTGVYRGRPRSSGRCGKPSNRSAEMRVEIRWLEEVGDDGMLYEVLVLIGPEDERSAQIAWYLSRFRDGLILSTAAFNTEALAREAIERGE